MTSHDHLQYYWLCMNSCGGHENITGPFYPCAILKAIHIEGLGTRLPPNQDT